MHTTCGVFVTPQEARLLKCLISVFCKIGIHLFTHLFVPTSLRLGTQVSCISCIGRQILYHFTTWEAPLDWRVLEK